MSSSEAPPSPSPSNSVVDVDITIVSAKHLKNVNWRRGDLKPYAVVYLAGFDADDHRRLVTKPDDAGSTRPVWNERFTLPVPSSLLAHCTLAIDVFHSKPSETPKPLVGTARCSLKQLIGSPYRNGPIRALELRRPSGRPQGKVRIKVSMLEYAPPPPSPPLPPASAPSTLPPANYHHVASPSWYHHPNAPTPQPSPCLAVSSSSLGIITSYPPPPPPAYPIPTPRLPPYQYAGCLSDPYLGYCPFGGYHIPAAVSMAMRLPWSYAGMPPVGGPSAPVDHSSSHRQQQRRVGRSNTEGSGAGLVDGDVAGAMGGLTLQEEVDREELFRRGHSDSWDNFRDDLY